MHDVMTGFYEPNAIDQSKNLGATFGTTTNIINGGIECGQNPENSKSRSRGEYYSKWLEFFGMPAEEGLGCGDQPYGDFPYAGEGDVVGYWAKDWSWPPKDACAPATY